MRGIKILQVILSIMVIPISITVLLLGMVVVPLFTAKSWDVFIHMFKKCKRFFPQISVAFWKLWNAKEEVSVESKMSLSMMFIVSVVGLPFISILLFLEEFT
jgi:hypothetical protein